MILTSTVCDRQTDARTEGWAIEYSALWIMLSRAKNVYTLRKKVR